MTASGAGLRVHAGVRWALAMVLQIAVCCAAMVYAPSVGAEPEPVPVDSPAETACSMFSAALDFAAINYDRFADATAGEQWAHGDPEVRQTNVAGRTALRQAAALVWEAASTPGLQPEIASSMRHWSAQATKLLLLMGVRAGQDRMNEAAAEVNKTTYRTQEVCAQATLLGSSDH